MLTSLHKVWNGLCKTVKKVATPEGNVKHRSDTLFAAIFVSVLVLVAVGCQQSGVEQAAGGETGSDGSPATTVAVEAGTTSSGETGGEARTGNGSAVAGSGEAEARAGDGQAQAGDATAGNGKARAGDVVAGDGEDGMEVEAEGDGGDRPGRVSLKVGGEPGTRFSGTCAVGGEAREISGRAPERFVYEPDGREVECEIHAQSPDSGPLQFSISADGGNQKQRISVTGDTMSFAYSGDSISYTTSSASGSASQRSTIISSSSSSSSVSSSSGSR